MFVESSSALFEGRGLRSEDPPLLSQTMEANHAFDICVEGATFRGGRFWVDQQADQIVATHNGFDIKVLCLWLSVHDPATMSVSCCHEVGSHWQLSPATKLCDLCDVTWLTGMSTGHNANECRVVGKKTIGFVSSLQAGG